MKELIENEIKKLETENESIAHELKKAQIQILELLDKHLHNTVKIELLRKELERID